MKQFLCLLACPSHFKAAKTDGELLDLINHLNGTHLRITKAEMLVFLKSNGYAL